MQSWESAPPLEFPVNGKTYRVTPIAEREYSEYLRWQAILGGKEDAPEPDEEGAQLLLGAYDEMLADKVPAAAIRRAMLTVFTELRLGREIAEQVWESGLTPEALAPKGADLESTQSSSTGAASGTRKRASTTGTSSPKATKRTGAKGKRSGS